MNKIKIGIIGCGTIGSEIAHACQTRFKNVVEIVGICDLSEEKALLLQKSLKGNIKNLKINDLIKKSELVIEAAGAGVSLDVLKKVIISKKSVLIMSVGGLLGNEKLLKKANNAGIKVYLPSGALCGVDGLKSASMGRIDSVTLTTRKPPKGLIGAPYIVKNNIDLSSIKEETVVFSGTALEAIEGFPQNINVAAVLSLAGPGNISTEINIVTSPEYTKNIHEVEIKGEFGAIVTRTENVPSKVNPKTSQLAIFSAIATLEGILNSVKFGT